MKLTTTRQVIDLVILTALWFFIILALSLLAGCGGGGGGGSSAAAVVPASAPASSPSCVGECLSPSSPASAPTPASAPPATTFRGTIMVRGDSTNYGSHPGETCQGAPNQTCANPVALMQADVNLLFGPGVWTVVNRAEPGSTLADDLNGTGPYTAGPLASELARTPANVVLTNSELNDATYGVPLGVYVAELDQWVATVRASGAVPVLMEPNPTCLGMPHDTLRPIDEPYVQAMNAVGAHLGVTVLAEYNGFLALTPAWQQYLQADCEHPTDQGYEAKEGLYMTHLYPVLKALAS